MGFSVSCPDWEDLASRMESLNLTQVYQDAASEVGAENEHYYQNAFAEAGVGDDFVGDVGTYVHRSGAVYMGIPGSSRFAEMAHHLEYGTPEVPPTAAVRATTNNEQDRIAAEMSDALDRHLGEALS